MIKLQKNFLIIIILSIVLGFLHSCSYGGYIDAVEWYIHLDLWLISIPWLLSLLVLWLVAEKTKTWGKAKIIIFLPIIISIGIQGFVYLFGPCFGVFGMNLYQVGSTCPESGLVSYLFLGGAILLLFLALIMFILSWLYLKLRKKYRKKDNS